MAADAVAVRQGIVDLLPQQAVLAVTPEPDLLVSLIFCRDNDLGLKVCKYRHCCESHFQLCQFPTLIA